MHQLSRIIKRLRHILTTVDSTKFAIGISMVATLSGLLLIQVFAFLTLNYHPDDVAQQVISHTWLESSIGGTWTPSNTYLIKIPIEWIIEIFTEQTRLSIFIVDYILTATMYIGTLLALMDILKSLSMNAARRVLLVCYPFTALIYSDVLVISLKNPNLRNAEIALSFMLIALIIRFLGGRFRNIRRRYRIAFFSTATGVLLLNDPSLTLFLILPIVTIVVAHFISGKNKVSHSTSPSIEIVGALAGGVAIYEFLVFVVTKSGWHMYKPAIQFLEPQDFHYFLSTAVDGAASLFGADFMGLSTVTPLLFVRLLNLFIFLMGLFACIYVVIRGNYILRAIALQPFILFFIYIFGSFSIDVNSARYLIVLLFYFVFCAAILINNIKTTFHKLKIILLGVLIIAAGLNLLAYLEKIYSSLREYNPATMSRNEFDYRVINVANSYGIKKGYAPFFLANNISYFSSYKINSNPIYCDSEKIRPFYWLTNESIFKEEANSSFVIAVDSNDSYRSKKRYASANLPAGTDNYSCPIEKVVAQFGSPQWIIPLRSDVDMLIYDYDVTNKIDMSRVTKTSPID